MHKYWIYEAPQNNDKLANIYNINDRKLIRWS
jgi:hypothetical protein